jgi:hypothetical protein
MPLNCSLLKFKIAVPSLEGKLSDGDIAGGLKAGSRGAAVPLAVGPPAGVPPEAGSPTLFTLLTRLLSTDSAQASPRPG